MRIQAYWHQHIAELGNAPGPQAGDVTVYLAVPVEGLGASFTLPSADIAAAAEGGSLHGFEVTLPDGRRGFLPASAVIAVLDAPKPDQRDD
jgi:hypothetical protein